ncbi:MAG: hypothetical protein WCR72_11575 [Bacteroidota bacterium]
MKKLFLYILFLGFGSAAQAQSVNLDSIFEPKLRGRIYQAKTGIEGNQFYNNEWSVSDIRLVSGETVFKKQLKYNVLLDEVIWLQAGTYNQVKLEKQFINEFSLENEKGEIGWFRRIHTKLPSMVDSADIFVQVLSEKAFALCVFRAVRVEGAVHNVNGVDLYIDKITPEPQYILVLPDRQTIFFKRISKRALAKALPEKYKSVFKEAIQLNRLSVRTEADLIKLVRLVE